jgi:hypothetical protein
MNEKSDQIARVDVSIDKGDITRRTIVGINIAAALKNAGYPVQIRENGTEIKHFPIPKDCHPQGTTIILDIIP